MIFFFQAEDGIRDGHVTGVQTCALPISTSDASSSMIVHNSIILGEINNFNQSQDDIFLNSLYSGADTEGTGNIDADGYASEDIFNDHRNGDYTPSPLTPSPAVNAGNNSLYPGNLQDEDRKSTRLNSSHVAISYAVFCL